MELLMVLMVFAAEWISHQALPVQTIQSDSNGQSKTSFSSSENSNEPVDDTRTIFERIEDVNKGISKPLKEGDIAYRISRSAIKCVDCLWDMSPNGMVYIPYVYAPNYTASEISVITSAMKEFEVMTCIKFVSRTAEKDYVSIETAPSCWSDIGKYGGLQTVNLDRAGCVSYGIAQHELMHSLGFFHEHTRSDRDNYIKIMWDYIIPSAKGNFDVQDPNNLGISYDYNSVMHYHKTAFAITSGVATIVPIPDPTVPIGQRVYLQLSDIHIPSSNGCNDNYIKIYDGRNTEARVLLSNTCGNVKLPPIISSGNPILLEFGATQLSITDPPKFNASYTTVSYGATLTVDNGVLSSPQFPKVYPNNVNGLWSIIAPVGSNVQLTFSFFELQPSILCSYDYLTIIDGTSLIDPVLGTFCSNNKPTTLVSSGNVMMIQFRSDSSLTYKGYTASYKFVTVS
ncbi:astacin-like metalloendopeptidase [Pelobates cultripes]|uniref:Metalloendopeptidase n=1 Tax=Pelobates cultripes TaxID=61616 RepID=A0AAD1R9N3_PELCU|nr:astacin-like metalloendopeptidase [Pelobates cultripes]